MSETERKREVSSFRASFERSQDFMKRRRLELKSEVEKMLTEKKGQNVELSFGVSDPTKSSDVWLFWLLSREDNSDKTVYCLFCGNSYQSKNGTTTLLRHTSNCECLKKELESLPIIVPQAFSSNSKEVLNKRQQSVLDLIRPDPIEKAKMLLVNMIYAARVPYAIVNRHETRTLFQYLANSSGPNARAFPPAREDVPIIGRRFVKFMSDHIRDSAFKVIFSTSIFSWNIIIDCWSDLSANRFLGIILRFLDKEFSPRDYVIGLKGSVASAHSAINLGAWIHEALARVGFDKYLSIQLTYRYDIFFLIFSFIFHNIKIIFSLILYRISSDRGSNVLAAAREFSRTEDKKKRRVEEVYSDHEVRGS